MGVLCGALEELEWFLLSLPYLPLKPIALLQILRIWMLSYFSSLYSYCKKVNLPHLPPSLYPRKKHMEARYFLNVILSTCNKIRGTTCLQENVRTRVPITRQSEFLPCPRVGVILDVGIEGITSPEHIPASFKKPLKTIQPPCSWDFLQGEEEREPTKMILTPIPPPPSPPSFESEIGSSSYLSPYTGFSTGKRQFPHN